MISDWQINGVFAAFSGTPFTPRERHVAEHAEQPADRGPRRHVQRPRQHRRRGRLVRHGRVRAADGRAVRQHRPQPVLRTRRLQPGPVGVPHVPAGRHAAARSPIEAGNVLNHASTATRRTTSRRAPSARSPASRGRALTNAAYRERSVTPRDCGSASKTRSLRAGRPSADLAVGSSDHCCFLHLARDISAVLLARCRSLALAHSAAPRPPSLSRSTPFRQRRATSHRAAHARCGRAAARTPDAAGALGASAARLGAVGRRARAPTRARRRSPRAASSGATWTRVVLQRLARPADAAARLREALRARRTTSRRA